MSRVDARRCLALVGLLGGLLMGALLLAAPADAHATVVASTPRDGSRLATAPRSVTVDFDEDVGLGSVGYLHVTDSTGARVDARAAYHPGGDGARVRDDLRAGLGDGTYTASFRVVSADSHPVSGTIAFVVGDGALVRGNVTTGNDDGVTDALFDVVRWVSYAGLVLLGGGWLVLTVWPQGRDDRRARRLLWTGLGVTAAGAVGELLAQGPYTAGESLAHAFSPALVDATLHTGYGQLHSARLVLLGALALVLAGALQPGVRRSARDVVAGLLGVAVLVTISAGGHAATTAPAWLSVAVDVLHLTAMAVWVGGLVLLALAVLPRREPAELRAVVPVFSTVALAAVVLLAGSGTYSAWRGIGSPAAVFTTSYGLLVLAKIGLLLAIVAVAAVSRQTVRGDGSTARLRRSVAAEAVVGVLVLAFAAVLVNQPRGRETLAARDRRAVTGSAALGGGHSVSVAVDPGVHGPVEVTVTLAGTTATSVAASATQRSRQLGPLPVRLRREGGDTFDGPVSLPVAGAWEFDLVVTQSQFDATSVTVTLDVH